MKTGITIQNRKARYEYFLLETFQAGIVLTGAEIKSIRLGGAELTDSFIFIDRNFEVWTEGLNIRKPKGSAGLDFNQKRQKKLLLRKKEILKLKQELSVKGNTIIPVSMYVNERGYAKMQIAIAKGKKDYDKRRDIKEKDLKRQERKERKHI